MITAHVTGYSDHGYTGPGRWSLRVVITLPTWGQAVTARRALRCGFSEPVAPGYTRSHAIHLDVNSPAQWVRVQRAIARQGYAVDYVAPRSDLPDYLLGYATLDECLAAGAA